VWNGSVSGAQGVWQARSSADIPQWDTGEDKAMAQSSTPDLAALVSRLSAAPPHQLVDEAFDVLSRDLGVHACSVLLADYSESQLEPVGGHRGYAPAGRQEVDRTPAGGALRHQRPVVVPVDGQVVSYLPVSVRAERLGVLEVRTDQHLSPGQLKYLSSVALVLGCQIQTARRYTDRFERIRRRRDLTLPAEMQWLILPALSYNCDHYAVAGSLEPAYEIGGDSFDYAADPEHLTLVFTDAMGRGLQAALMGTLAITAMRNTRRRGGGLVEQVQDASSGLHEHFPSEGFVTASTMQIDLATGRGMAVNAGHQLPLLLRDGSIRNLSLAADLPLGLFEDARYRSQPVTLEPGDRLLLYSDGVSEARPEGGEMFGEKRVRRCLREGTDLTASELVRQLTQSVRSHRADELKDDATAVCLDWHGA
jgi:serine phosphatase RsbU (regulator of sigma subunit)